MSDSAADKHKSMPSGLKMKKGLSLGDYETPTNFKHKRTNSDEKQMFFSSPVIQ